MKPLNLASMSVSWIPQYLHANLHFKNVEDKSENKEIFQGSPSTLKIMLEVEDHLEEHHIQQSRYWAETQIPGTETESE